MRLKPKRLKPKRPKSKRLKPKRPKPMKRRPKAWLEDAKQEEEAKAKEAVDKVLPIEPEASAETNVVLMDKDKDTVSDVKMHEARRLSKKDSALAVVRERSERDRKLAASQQSIFQENNTAKLIIRNTKVGHGYDPFALPDKHLSKALTEHLKKDPKSFERKPKRCLSYWYQVIQTPLAWLLDTHMNAYINVLRFRHRNNPNHFKSERICFLDHLFSRMWRDKYGEFKSSTPDHNGLGRRLSGGSWDLYAGIVPIFCATNKIWDVDINDIYAPVNFQNDHWIAIWISIPKRHIVV
ncbi:hypothetical protein N665_0101s0003 [Sinapis alba]|nr:hypothetical protein N665_0101s0003 [Sinapis alba]